MTQSPITMRQLTEPLGMLALGLLLTLASRSPFAPYLLPAGLVPYRLDPMAVRQLFHIFGVSFLLMGLTSLLLARNGTSIGEVCAAEWNAERGRLRFAVRTPTDGPRSRLSLAAAAVLLGLGIILRAYFLTQPMRYDESISFLNFVDGAGYKLFVYSKPNNHVLNSILEKASCWILGDGPIGIRFPAFVSGLLLMLFSYRTARRLVGASGGLFSTLLVATSPFLILFSTNGRGYSLLALIVVLILFVSLEPDGRALNGRWGLASLLSALGMLAMPSMLYAIAGLATWFLAVHVGQSRSWKRTLTGFLAPYAIATAFLTLLLYSPVLLFSGGTRAITSNRFVQPLSLGAFIGGAPAHVLETLHDSFRDVPLPLLLLAFALTLWGVYSAAREGKRALAWLLPAMLAGSSIVFAAKRSLPFTRTWIYLLPVMALLADAGFTQIRLRLSQGLGTASLLAVCAFGIGYSYVLMASDCVAAYPDTGAFAKASEVADWLAKDLSAGDGVCAEQPADGTTAYYLWRDLKPADYRSRPVQARRFLVHIGAPIQDEKWNESGATIAYQSDSYVIYEGSQAAGKADAVASSTCWSPALQAGVAAVPAE